MSLSDTQIADAIRNLEQIVPLHQNRAYLRNFIDKLSLENLSLRDRVCRLAEDKSSLMAELARAETLIDTLAVALRQ